MDEALARALVDPSLHPGRSLPIECHETHGSWVFVGGDRALKVKKPLVLPFLDYGTLERRRAMCREEVRLNRRLSPDIYLGTVAILTGGPAGYRLDADDAAQGAVEVAVLMRRYDEADTLAARSAAGQARPAQMRAVAERLAAFHAANRRPELAAEALASLREAVRTTLDDLEDAWDDDAAALRLCGLRLALETALVRRRSELIARGVCGLVVDGHGDLRAEHILLTDPVQIVDAVEFDERLRIADVACDLGFLTMDLEGQGAGELVEALIEHYRDAGGDPGDPPLLALMACYRALVRAKVDLARARQSDPTAVSRAEARMEEAERWAWRARGPQLFAICGPPATGKSTIARALCEQGAMAHITSDVVRKQRVGLGAAERAPRRAYDHDVTLATYRELGVRAAAALDTGHGAVIDATLGDPAARDALREGLGGAASQLRYVECRVPSREAWRRARLRERDPMRESDATTEVAARLAATWEPLDEVPADRHLTLRTDRPTDQIVSDVATWLDRSLGELPQRAPDDGLVSPPVSHRSER